MKITSVHLKWYALILIYVLCALLFTQLYLTHTSQYGGATPEQLTRFTAERPYQYRILIPALVRVLEWLIDVELVTVYFALTFLNTLALLFCFRYYLRHFLSESAASLGALAILYPMLWNFTAFCTWKIFYPSDVPAILLFVLGLTALADRRWVLFYIVFVLASFNRETSCFLSFACLFALISRQTIRPLLIHLAAQVLIWVAIKLTLQAAFSGNDGSQVDLMWHRNLEILSSIVQLQVNESLFAALSTCGFIWVLIPLGGSALPVFLKRVLLTVIPFYALLLVVGNLDELRVYNELIPVLTAPAVFSVSKRGLP